MCVCACGFVCVPGKKSAPGIEKVATGHGGVGRGGRRRRARGGLWAPRGPWGFPSERPGLSPARHGASGLAARRRAEACRLAERRRAAACKLSDRRTAACKGRHAGCAPVLMDGSVAVVFRPGCAVAHAIPSGPQPAVLAASRPPSLPPSSPARSASHCSSSPLRSPPALSGALQVTASSPLCKSSSPGSSSPLMSSIFPPDPVPAVPAALQSVQCSPGRCSVEKCVSDTYF